MAASPIQTPCLIIGAGPAGLAVAGRLRNLKLPFELVEQQQSVGWSWQNHYDRLALHTVKQFSHLPHLPFPEDYPLYVPREDFVRYLQTYTQEFDIQPRFGQEVEQLEKSPEGWLVRIKEGPTYQTPSVVIASGVNRVPHVPTWPEQETFQGRISHSRAYRNPDPFLKQKVLVVGMGNTGAEVALDLCKHGVETWISVRSPISIVPRDINGRPVQVTAKTLEKFPFGLGDWLGTQIRKVVIGDLTKYGVPMSKLHPVQQLRETGKTPVIDLGTVAKIKSGEIKILPNFERFYEQGVVLEDGTQHAFDQVLLCTGYRAQLQDFVPQIDEMLDQYGVPSQPVGTGVHRGLYFVGYDNYKVGGILGTIFTDSEIVAEAIKAAQQ
ncbi:MAG: NAD(P)/FAD-dependent oxidoreductase [Bacteroidota bacterium]